MKNPSNPKERNLLKGAIRRVFSRSELRRKALSESTVGGYKDVTRPRVTKWSVCPRCGQMTPTYQMQVDHIEPVIKVNETLDDLTWDQLVDRIWCKISNLVAICKPCHKVKTKQENAERRKLRKKS